MSGIKAKEFQVTCCLDCKETLKISTYESENFSLEILNAQGTRKQEVYLTGKSAEDLKKYFAQFQKKEAKKTK